MNYSIIRSKCLQLNNLFISRTTSIRCYSPKPKEEPPEIPVNLLKDIHGATHQKLKGLVYDIKPFKMPLEAGKMYNWCACGHSKGQPFCDGFHANIHLANQKLKPVKFQVAKSKEYWLCNCKQTKNRPFCDGSHMTPGLTPKKW